MYLVSKETVVLHWQASKTPSNMKVFLSAEKAHEFLSDHLREEIGDDTR